MSKHIVVIGSGFGGLGAAIRLLSRGYTVDVIEKLDKPGGRGYVFEINGHTFDAGPTVITAPFMFDDLWNAAGGRREDDVDFVPLSPFYRIFNHEGRAFDYNADPAFTEAQIAKWSPTDVEGYKRFLATTKSIFQKGFVELADKPFLGVGDMLKVAPDLIRLGSHRSVYDYVSGFIKDEFLRRCFSFHPLLIGGNPFDASSIYAMIHYLEREWGVHYVRGGTGALVRAMARLIERLGGKIHYNAEVDEIIIDDKGRRATGVRLKDGRVFKADSVVSNADVAFTYKHLIPAQHRRGWIDWRINSMRYSMSLFVLYFGTSRKFRDRGLAHHNIILGERYRGLLDDIFNKKTVSDDFSLYLHQPSLTDPSVAPEGGETFYVLSPVPHLGSGTDWRTAAKPYRDRILNFLEENYLPGLQASLSAEHWIDPLYFRDTLNSHLGSAFSVEPVLTQSAWFRPHNRSENFENLYFVGAGTHPGAGLPGVLSSSKIAEDLIVAGEPQPMPQPQQLAAAH